MKTTIKGQKNAVRKYGYEPLIAPLAYFKKTIQTVYEGFFDIVFLTSTGKQSFDDGASGLLFGLVFVVLCVVASYLKEQEILIFFLLLTIFIIDKYAAQFHYLHLDPKRETLLKVRGDTAFFEELFKRQLLRREKFLSDTLEAISIDRFELVGGAFQGRLDEVWRVCLHWQDQDTPIVFHHSQDAAGALSKAIEVSNSFPLLRPITFSHSVGAGSYACSQLQAPEKVFYINKCCHTVKFQNDSSQQWSIRSCWGWESYFRMISEVFRAVGFSLALILTVSLMGELGGLLITIVQGSSLNAILEQLGTVNRSLLPVSNLTEISETVVISLALLSRHLNISLAEEITISRDSFEYYLNKKLLGKVSTQNVKSILLIEQGEPVILISDQVQTIEIPGLQTLEEFKAFLYRIIEAVEYFQKV